MLAIACGTAAMSFVVCLIKKMVNRCFRFQASLYREKLELHASRNQQEHTLLLPIRK